MSLNNVTLTGTLPGAAGATAIFTRGGWLADSTDDLLLPPVPSPVILDGNGKFSISLLATDNAAPTPSGWTWTVNFVGVPSVPSYSFSFFLPFSGGATQDISSIAQVPAVTPMAQYLPLTGGTLTGDLAVDTNDAAGGSLIVANAHTTPSSPSVQFMGATAGDQTLGVSTTGDTNPRFQVGSDGFINLGPGNGATDTVIKRNAANSIQLGSLFATTGKNTGKILVVQNTTASPSNPSTLLQASQSGDAVVGVILNSGDTQNRWTLDSNGKMGWGPGGSTATDTTLFRSGAGTLQTSKMFMSAGGSAQPVLQVNNVNSAPTVPGTSLFANAAADKTVGISVIGDTVPRLVIDSNGMQSWGPGGSTAADTTLFRNSAGELATGLNFTASGTSKAAKVQVTGISGATAASRYAGATASGAPSTGTFITGDFVVDQSGAVWVCSTGGSPGTWARLGAQAPWHTNKSGAFVQGQQGVNTSATLGNGTLRLEPLSVVSAFTMAAIGVEFTVAGDAASLCHLAVFADDGTGYPGALLQDCGSISTGTGNAGTFPTGGTPGLYFNTGMTALPLLPGLYWVGAVLQGVTVTQPTFRVGNFGNQFSISTPSSQPGGTVNACYTQSGVTSTLPGTFVTFASSGAGGSAYRIAFKIQ